LISHSEKNFLIFDNRKLSPLKIIEKSKNFSYITFRLVRSG